MSKSSTSVETADIKRPRGTRDLMPREMLIQRRTEQCIIETFEQFGYQEIKTPIFETIALFEIRSGKKFRDDIYHFVGPTKERQEGSTVEYALRPELTAPTCRFFITGKLGATPKPLKAFYLGPCFRYDTPAVGRYREFTQAGIELFGSDSVKADAEVVAIAATTVIRLGIPISEFRIQLNDINITRTYLSTLNLAKSSQNQILNLIDNYGSNIAKSKLGVFDVSVDDLILEFQSKLEGLELKSSNITILTNLLDLKGGEEVLDKAVEIFADFPLVVEAINNSGLKAVFVSLKGIKVKNLFVDFSIARGLDYYTGLVFEIDVDKLGAQKQICGGGRYDNLVAEYGGHDTPATGFAFGVDRLVQCVEIFSTAILPKPREFARADVFLKVLLDDFSLEVELATELRNAGIRVETDVKNRGLGNGLTFASKLKIPIVLILGQKEYENKQIQVRDLTSEPWTEEMIEFEYDQLISYLKKILH